MSRSSSTARPGALVAIIDLLAVAGFAIVASGLLIGGVVSGTGRVLLAGALLGLCPGYAVVSALYPVRSPSRLAGQPHTGWLHRIGLSVGASLFVLVLTVLPLSALGFATTTVVGVVLAAIFLGVGVAAVRRLRVPADERIRPPMAALFSDARDATRDSSALDTTLNVALAIVVIAGVASLAVGLAAPEPGANYTEVALTDGGETTDGAAVYTAGESASVPLTVENRGGGEKSYTAVVALERIGDAGDGGSAAVLERSVLSRTNVTAAGGETTTESLAFEPSTLGSELRLSVYVYAGAAPADPDPESAAYHLYRWVEVTDGSESLPPAGG